MNTFLLTLVALLIAFGPQVRAATTWNGAMIAYQRKAESLETLARARQAFEDIHSQNGSNTLRAAEYLARLDIYEAQHYRSAGSTARRTVLETCWQTTVRRFSATGVGGADAGAYWKAMCLALWAETYTGLSRINVLGTMRSEFLPLVDRLAQASPTYSGGGSLRILAGFHGSNDANRLRSGSFDSDLALNEIDQALALTQAAGGVFHYLNLAVKALVLADAGDRAGSQATLRDLIAAAEAELAGPDSDPVSRDEVQVLIDEARQRLDRR